MNKDLTILIADDDAGHALLIKKNLQRAGISNDFIFFRDGQEVLNFFFPKDGRSNLVKGKSYLLLLDIRMPKIDGVEVLAKIKSDSILKKIPIIMITTTDDPAEIEKCHLKGCNAYIVKPVDYDRFINAILQVGLLLSIVEVPEYIGY